MSIFQNKQIDLNVIFNQREESMLIFYARFFDPKLKFLVVS